MDICENGVRKPALTVSQVAKLLSLSRTKIYQMMDDGELKYMRFGRSRRIPQEALDQLMQSSMVDA